MPRQKVEGSGTSWEDIAQAVPAWEAEHGVRVACTVVWEPRLPSGAAVEVVLMDGAPFGEHREVLRVRQPFPTRKAAGQAGAVMHAIFLAFMELDRNPWLWAPRRRQEARGEP